MKLSDQRVWILACKSLNLSVCLRRWGEGSRICQILDNVSPMTWEKRGQFSPGVYFLNRVVCSHASHVIPALLSPAQQTDGLHIWPQYLSHLSPCLPEAQRLTMSALLFGASVDSHSSNACLRYLVLVWLVWHSGIQFFLRTDLLFYLRFRWRLPPFLPGCGLKEVKSSGPVWRSRERWF